jgi:hypothetical protein
VRSTSRPLRFPCGRTSDIEREPARQRRAARAAGAADRGRSAAAAFAAADAFLGLGSHYGRLAQGAPEYAALPRALVLCLAQAVFWVPLTLVFGGLAGLLALGLGRRRARAQTTAQQTAAQSAQSL